MYRTRTRGLNLIELMIVAIVIIVLTVMAIPNFIAFMQRYRLVTTIQSIYYNLQYARSEALKKGINVYIFFQTGSNWCYGISTSNCNCSTPSSCNLGTFTPPPSQLTTLSTSSIFSITGSTYLSFDGSRGTADPTGNITLTVTGGTSSMGIDIGSVGNLQICSANVSGYPAC